MFEKKCFCLRYNFVKKQKIKKKTYISDDPVRNNFAKLIQNKKRKDSDR